MSITKKTLNDLEFHLVLDEVKTYAISELGIASIDEIIPFSDKDANENSLHLTDEYLSSFDNNNLIPNHNFYDISNAIHLLKIENTFIEAKDLLEIAVNSQTLLDLSRFFKKFKEIYPFLYTENREMAVDKELIKLITSKITKYAEVADKASFELQSIRNGINKISGQIGASFNRALKQYLDKDYLDVIKESVVEGKRVLAVQAKHRKKISGSLLGTSKTGSIVYIAPQATLKYLRELQELELEEKEEVIRILKEITNYLRPYRELLILHKHYFTNLDVTAAKAKYANATNALLPKLVKEKTIFLKEAYHPILWKQNKDKNIKTIPQTIELNTKQQIIVISGPNAGGKSITLKTIGLLQVMLQSGLLVPVDEKSKMSFFKTILTDIGDNQSIENQLSTYSYRLKNMGHFLRKCDNRTLFLIDEFGTGSDPELGGALAEVFLEDFYNKKAFGVITTHYANLKSLADELEFATNANMQFDKRSHEPLFELHTGQAGSSFTFEVAIQNGIPYSLINRAKKRVSQSKIRLDKTISKLQTERNKLQRKTQSLDKEQDKAQEKTQELTDKQQKIQTKLEQFQTLYDSNQKMLQYGREINELLNKYFQNNNKKQLNDNFLKWVQTERVKYTKKNPPKKQTKNEKKVENQQKTKQKNILKQTEKEVLHKVVKVRVQKKKEAVEIAKKITNYIFNIGDTVRLIDSRAQGTIERIDKKSILINYGTFTTKTTKEKIELVKANRRK
ncbi:MAG TPA: DNA mismatch repair protein MutS [Lutibacter sp.]|nr:DNA mismatch repair protein MutS [Lutibacter sp.]